MGGGGQQPSAAVWRSSKVQPWGAALHLGTKCNCLGAADGRPSLDEQMEICGKTYVPNLHISGRKCGFGVIRGLASLAPTMLLNPLHVDHAVSYANFF